MSRWVSFTRFSFRGDVLYVCMYVCMYGQNRACRISSRPTCKTTHKAYAQGIQIGHTYKAYSQTYIQCMHTRHAYRASCIQGIRAIHTYKAHIQGIHTGHTLYCADICLRAYNLLDRIAVEYAVIYMCMNSHTYMHLNKQTQRASTFPSSSSSSSSFSSSSSSSSTPDSLALLDRLTFEKAVTYAHMFMHTYFGSFLYKKGDILFGIG